jgi:hypothetical protein
LSYCGRRDHREALRAATPAYSPEIRDDEAEFAGGG